MEKINRIAQTVSAASVAIVAIIKTGSIAVGVIAFLVLIYIIKDV